MFEDDRPVGPRSESGYAGPQDEMWQWCGREDSRGQIPMFRWSMWVCKSDGSPNVQAKTFETLFGGVLIGDGYRYPKEHTLHCNLLLLRHHSTRGERQSLARFSASG